MEPATDATLAYQRHGPALVRKAERIVGNRDDAADLVHGLFVDQVASRASRWDLPYLYRAITNRCLNLLRDGKNRARLLEQQGAALAPPRVTCADRVVGLDLIAKLDLRLDPKHMDVLVCRFIDEMGQEEIAEHLGVSRKTVQKRLDRIRVEVTALAAPATEVVR